MRPALKGRAVLSAAPIVGFIVAIGEMFLMSSPFAAYFYGAYSPLLGLTHAFPALAWLSDFWVLHVVPTTATGALFALGVILAIGGIALFVAHAAYLYWMKFRRKAIATRLLYGVVRHPQYTCLIVSGAGLAVLWPRLVNLVLFLAMAGAYYALARSEEERMKRDFPLTYLEYARSKPMFVPGGPGRWIRRRIASRVPGRTAQTAAMASLCALLTLGGAFAARSVSLRSLETILLDAEGTSLLVGYAAGVPEIFFETLESIAAEDRVRDEARLLLIADEREVLDHILIDSGVRREAIRQLDLSPGDFYLVRTTLPGTRFAADGMAAGSLRRLDGVYSLRRAGGTVVLSRASLADDSLYRHAAVPLL